VKITHSSVSGLEIDRRFLPDLHKAHVMKKIYTRLDTITKLGIPQILGDLYARKKNIDFFYTIQLLTNKHVWLGM